MFAWVIRMLQYERIGVSEGTDTDKTSASKNVCFVIIGISKILVINLNQMFVINDYRCILWGIIRNEAVNILNNSAFEDKGVL